MVARVRLSVRRGISVEELLLSWRGGKILSGRIPTLQDRHRGFDRFNP